MKRLLNVRWRLTLWYGAVLTGIVIGFGACVYVMMTRHLLFRTDFELEEELQELQVEVQLANNETQLQQQLKTRYFHHFAFDFQVSRLDGQILFRSERLQRQPDLAIAPKLPLTGIRIAYHTTELSDLGRMRSGCEIAKGPRVTVVNQAFVPLQPNATELQELLRMMLMLGPLAIAAALAGGRFLAWHAMAPVDRMTATAAKISGARLQERIEVESPRDELGTLARTLNSMMDRVEVAMNELRRFTADAAHELRTPLAVLHTEVEVALRAPRSAEEYRRVIEVIWAELQRLGRLADQLLQLSRHDMGTPCLPGTEVPLDALLIDVVEHLRILAKQRGVRIELGPFREWVVPGDDIQLSRLLFNLVENAIKFTPPGGLVKIEAVERQRQIEIVISDTGIGISAADLPHVCERFYRADKSRNGQTGGTGLGLAISQAIIQAHGGTLQINSEVDVGTTVKLSLPLLSSDQSRLLR